MLMVLVVEDDRYILDAIRKIFEIFSINGIYAKNGQEALSTLNSSEQVDLILCDIQLPDIDGYEILSRVKSNVDLMSIPFIFLTAFADPNDIRQGMNMGADDYITKPFSAKVLVDAVNSRLKIYRQKKDLLNDVNRGTIFNVLNNNFNHEFLTPLNGIINSVEILQDTQLKPDYNSIVELLVAIKTAGYRMLSNTKKLMMYSLLSSDALIQSSDRKKINMAELISTEVSQKEQSRYIRNAAKSLDDRDILVEHKEHVEFVVKELIDNAYRYSPEGSDVNINFRIEGEYAYFNVENTMDEYNSSFTLDNVSVFYKFHSDKSLNGFGIGLFLCKELTSKLHQNLYIEHNRPLVNVSFKFKILVA